MDTPVLAHAIFVDHDGHPLTPNIGSQSQNLDSVTYGRYIHRLLDSVRVSRKHEIFLWIHGGMVALPQALKNTERLVQEMKADESQADAYPIAINWESGIGSSYREHLLSLRQGTRETRPLAIAITAPFYFLADLGRAVSRAPQVWLGQVARFWQRDHPQRVRDSERRLFAAQDSVLNPATGSHTGQISVSIGRYNNTLGDHITRFAGTPLFPIKMIGTLLVDGGGTPGWEVMHRRTKTMFRPPNEFKMFDTAGRFVPATGAVAVFLDSLETLTRDTSAHFTVTIVGHSMGTIVATEAIRTHPKLPIAAIVFMAGASSIREFVVGVIPYLLAHGATRFYNLTLHPLADRREFNVAHLAPDGSLLEWVDGYLASPETEMDRVIGKWNNIIVATQIFPDSIRGQIHIKAFGYRDSTGFGKDGLEPHTHGEFDSPGVPFWRCQFWQPATTQAECTHPGRERLSPRH